MAVDGSPSKIDWVGLPKAELHLHLEGAIRPATAEELASRYGLPMPRRGRFADLTEFTGAYERARDLIGSLDDLNRVAREVVADVRAAGVWWLEVHVFPSTYAGRLGPDEAVLEAVLDGLHAASDERTGAAVILGINRGLPLSAAESTVRLASRYAGQHGGVVGLGLAGDEANYPADPFAEVFARAAAAGLPAFPHGGEGAGPESVRSCVERLGARRVCHGVNAVRDPALLALLVERDVCLDVCPTSNIALRVAESYVEHPLAALLDAGVPVSLGADCPLFLGSSVADEYALVAEHLRAGASTLADIAESSLRHSCAPPDRSSSAMAVLDSWRQRHQAS